MPHRLIAVPSNVPDYRCPFAPQGTTVWAIIAERVIKMGGRSLIDRS